MCLGAALICPACVSTRLPWVLDKVTAYVEKQFGRENPDGRAVAPNGGAAKQRPRARAPRTTMARTEVREPIYGGETLSSIGHVLAETPQRRIFAPPPPPMGVYGASK